MSELKVEVGKVYLSNEKIFDHYRIIADAHDSEYRFLGENSQEFPNGTGLIFRFSKDGKIKDGSIKLIRNHPFPLDNRVEGVVSLQRQAGVRGICSFLFYTSQGC